MIRYLSLALLGVQLWSLTPEGHQYVLLPTQDSQPRYFTPVDRQSVYVLANNPLYRFVSPYAGQNGIIYLRNDANEQPGFVYNWILGNPNVQDQPAEKPEEPSTPTKPELVGEEDDNTVVSENEPDIDSTNFKEIEEKTNEPGSSQPEVTPEKLEEFEPDAELIPDSVKKQSTPQQPQIPIIPFLRNPAIIPGQRFFILNGSPQYISGSPYPGYPQINTFGTQPATRYPGYSTTYPQSFYIVGQSSPLQQRQYNQAVLLLNGEKAEQLRKGQAQNIQVPPADQFSQREIEDESAQQQIEEIQEEDQPKETHYMGQVQSIPSIGSTFQSDVSLRGNIPPHFASYGLPPAFYQKSYVQQNQFLQDTTETKDAKETNNEDEAILVNADSENDEKKKPEWDHMDLKNDPVLAEAKPQAIAIAGKNGLAQSYPKGTALAGPEGLAVSSPVATALAGTKKSDA